MEHILHIDEFLNESYQRKLTDEDWNKKMFRFFEQVFYEIKNKRHDYPFPHQLAKLTPESREYLLDVLDVVKTFDDKYQRTGQFLHPDNNRPLTTEDELISYLASNFFSGFGRSSKLGSSYAPIGGLRLPMPPSQTVVDNIADFAKSR